MRGYEIRGENGPELVNFHPTGRVLSKDEALRVALDESDALLNGMTLRAQAAEAALVTQKRDLMGIVDGVLLDLDQTRIQLRAELATSDAENEQLRADNDFLRGEVEALKREYADAVKELSAHHLGQLIDADRNSVSAQQMTDWLRRGGVKVIEDELKRRKGTNFGGTSL